MNLIQKAKAKAREQAERKTAEEQAQEKASKRLHNALKPLAKMTMEAIQTLEGEKVKGGGKFKILTGNDAWFCGTQYLAIIYRFEAKYPDRIDYLVFVKAAVESGTTDMSDDVRNVTWTEPMVSFASQVSCYAYNEANPPFHTSGSNKEEVEKALDKLAKHLTHYVTK